MMFAPPQGADGSFGAEPIQGGAAPLCSACGRQGVG